MNNNNNNNNNNNRRGKQVQRPQNRDYRGTIKKGMHGRKHQGSIRESYSYRNPKDQYAGTCMIFPPEGAHSMNRMNDLNNY